MHEDEHRAHRARIHAFRLRGRVITAIVIAAALVYLQQAMSLWIDRTGMFISVLGLAVAAVLLVDWVLDLIGPPLWRLLKSVAKTAALAAANDPEVRRWVRRYPRSSAWVRRRLTLTTWTGLYLTTTVVVAAIFLGGFLSIATSIVIQGDITQYDPQVTALMTAFRSPSLTRFLWVFTVLGDVRVAFPLALVIMVLLELWSHRRDALFFAASVGGGATLGALAKLAFQRLRPDTGIALVMTPESFSFPSGHALHSLLIAFSLAFIVIRGARTFRSRLVALGLATFFTLLTALSRVYLGVHWMSDTFASWLLGLSWLTVCAGVLVSYERYSGVGRERPTTDRPLMHRVVTVTVSVVAAVTVVWGAQRDPLLAAAIDPPPTREWKVTRDESGTPRPTADQVAELPRWAENVDGSRMSPIGLVFVGTREDLLTAFERAGWQIAEHPNVTNVTRSLVAAIADQPYPTAPVTPSFMGGRVHDVAFQRAAGRATARRRHHTRWWRTRYVVEGVPVWVATASLDAGIGAGPAIGVPTHRIDPNIDAEQRYIARGLVRGGAARIVQRVRVTSPTTGTNTAGDAWFTTGLATLMTPAR